MLSTEVADLKAHMAANPGAVIEDVARERKVSPRAVLEAMPETMVRFGGGGEFGAVMNDVAQWGEVTLIVHTDDAIFEFTGSIPAGGDCRTRLAARHPTQDDRRHHQAGDRPEAQHTGRLQVAPAVGQLDRGQRVGQEGGPHA